MSPGDRRITLAKVTFPCVQACSPALKFKCLAAKNVSFHFQAARAHDQPPVVRPPVAGQAAADDDEAPELFMGTLFQRCRIAVRVFCFCDCSVVAAVAFGVDSQILFFLQTTFSLLMSWKSPSLPLTDLPTKKGECRRQPPRFAIHEDCV